MMPWELLKMLDKAAERLLHPSDTTGDTISAHARASDDPVDVLLLCGVDLFLLRNGAPINGGIDEIKTDVTRALRLLNGPDSTPRGYDPSSH